MSAYGMSVCCGCRFALRETVKTDMKTHTHTLLALARTPTNRTVRGVRSSWWCCRKAFVLLAAASRDGTCVIYKIFRTEMEKAMMSEQTFPEGERDGVEPSEQSAKFSVHSRLVGHSRAITSAFFNSTEDWLVTTSIDKTMRVWRVDNGETLKAFTDSAPLPTAAFLPHDSRVLVVANSNAVLKLVDVENGSLLQNLKIGSEVRALKVDDTGLFLFAGTKDGAVHVLEAPNSTTLEFKFQVQIGCKAVTCITFVPASHGRPACLLVNTVDDSVHILDCTYGPPAGILTNLTVRHRCEWRTDFFH